MLKNAIKVSENADFQRENCGEAKPLNSGLVLRNPVASHRGNPLSVNTKGTA
jgi:hypothetical protein